MFLLLVRLSVFLFKSDFFRQKMYKKKELLVGVLPVRSDNGTDWTDLQTICFRIIPMSSCHRDSEYTVEMIIDDLLDDHGSILGTDFSVFLF